MRTQSRIRIETFEQLLLEQTLPLCPMAFSFEFVLDRRPDLDRLIDAVSSATTRHPMLTAHIDPQNGQWILGQNHVHKIFDHNDPQLMHIDLQNQAGLRIAFDENDSAPPRVTFVFHHACTDGLGAIRFINDVLTIYRGDKLKNNFDTVSYLRNHRRSYGRNRLWHLLRWPFDLFAMCWSFELFFNKPAAFVSLEQGNMPSTEASANEDGEHGRVQLPGYLQTVLDEKESAQALRTARQNGLTLNDWALSTCFFAIHHHFLRLGTPSGTRLERLLVPVNLRKQTALTAANMVAMVNLDRRPERWSSFQKFRRILSWEMRAIKRLGLGVTSIRFFQVQRWLLGGWPTLQNSQATCALSNLGVLEHYFEPDLRFGDAAVQRVQVIGPVGRSANILLILYSWRNQMHLDATYNRMAISKSDVADFLEAFRDLLLDRGNRLP